MLADGSFGPRVIRVFPRRTKATPTDELAYTGEPDLFAEADAVHVSVTFSWDIPQAERLAEVWRTVAPVTLGGPAYNTPSGAFVPGFYLRPGYVITSRGCPNRCWFCNVWRREGATVHELPIMNGWNVLDDNLLACSEAHVRDVFAMLTEQRHRVEFTGGLEAARLQPWHVELLANLKPKQVFFAYDTSDDLEPLYAAAALLRDAEIIKPTSHVARCYVLVGYPKDTFAKAEQRLTETLAAGYMPMAMLYRDAKGETSADWRTFQRQWARPTIVATKMRKE